MRHRHFDQIVNNTIRHYFASQAKQVEERFRTFMAIAGPRDSSCRQHKSYKGKSFPKARCFRCWELYFAEHRDKAITGGELLVALDALATSLRRDSIRIEENVRRDIISRLEQEDE